MFFFWSDRRSFSSCPLLKTALKQWASSSLRHYFHSNAFHLHVLKTCKSFFCICSLVLKDDTIYICVCYTRTEFPLRYMQEHLALVKGWFLPLISFISFDYCLNISDVYNNMSYMYIIIYVIVYMIVYITYIFY